MHFFINRILKNHRGENLLDGPHKESAQPLTLGALAVEALLRELQQDNNAPGNTKIARWKLAQEVQKNLTVLDGSAEDFEKVLAGMDQGYFILLKTEDVNLIKTRIQQAFPAMIVGPAEVALEAEEEPAKLKKA